MRQVERPSVMTMGQQTLMDNVDSGLRSEPLTIAASAVCGRAGVAQTQRMKAELAHRRSHCLAFGERKRDALIARQRRAKSLALRRIDPGFIERRLCRRNALQANERAAEIESLRHLNKAGVLCTERLARGTCTSSKKIRQPIALLPRSTNRLVVTPGCLHRHEKSAYAVRAVLDVPGAGKDQDGIGLIGNADRGLSPLST